MVEKNSFQTLRVAAENLHELHWLCIVHDFKLFFHISTGIFEREVEGQTFYFKGGPFPKEMYFNVCVSCFIT